MCITTYLPVVVLEPSLELLDGAKAELGDEALEQAGADVAVGLVTVLSGGAQLADRLG